MRVLLCFVALCGLVSGQGSTPVTPSWKLLRIATGIPNITEIETPRPDTANRLFLVGQRGTIRILKDGTLLPAPFLDVSARVSCCGERGLLGLAFPPGFVASQRFYIYYTDVQGNIVISRMRVSSSDPDRADPASEQILLTVAHPDFSNHNGGRITFGPDGYLYAGLGDGGGAGDPRGNGQNLSSLLGKLLRLDVESGSASGPYAVPPSNPFVGQAGARPEIWSFGLRNPWKFSFDRQIGDLYIADVGQVTLEEINYQPAASRGGENYGWNRTEGTQCYSPRAGCDRSGLTFPVFEYGRDVGVSITGGYVYRGRALPELQGAYIYSDYARGQIWALRRGAAAGAPWTNELLLTSGMQVSSFGLDTAGELYIASYGEGALYRLAPGSPNLTVRNSASFGEGVVPGSLATVFGSGIAPVVGIAQPTAFPLPRELAGVSVTFDGTPAPILAVASVQGQDQINVQVPWELAGRTAASMVVTTNTTALPAVDVALRPVQPAIFTVTRQPGAWTIWATGLGPVSAQGQTGQAAPASPLATTSGEVLVTVNGVRSTVLFSGLAPGFAGLYQVNIAPPPDMPASAEVIISVGSVSSVPWRPAAPQP